MELIAYNLNEVIQTKTPADVGGNRRGHFWELAPFDGGVTWISKWVGESPWERHSKGDEFIHVLKGEVEIIVMTTTGKYSVHVAEGGVFVVPKNHWHRQVAVSQVTVLGATPGVTDHLEIDPQETL